MVAGGGGGRPAPATGPERHGDGQAAEAHRATVPSARPCQSKAVTATPLAALVLPYRTSALPGIGGHLRASDDDFAVDELPAYPPSGEGDHVFVHIEKRGLTTPEAANRLAAAAGVPARDVGWAGMKDRHAVTRQWLSLPPPARPEQLADLAEPGLTVLAAVRHRHKLRTGHLHGNRFALVVRGLDDASVAAAQAEAIFAALAAGAPNWYGEQRFGARGDNPAAGLAVIRSGGKGGGPPKRKRFLVSALQSHLFNQWLCERLADGLDRTVLAGDVLTKPATGGMFVSSEPEIDQPRLDAGEVALTGPMFGAAMRSPPDGSPAHVREARLLDAIGLGPADFARLGGLASGTRRVGFLALAGTAVEVVAPDAIRVTFSLPAGAYATAILREVQKCPDGFGADAAPADADALDDSPADRGAGAAADPSDQPLE
ncbi:MAG: tRNA pseudouridine(13) synthase TruD [Myxococcales bacterium]|nr:tRNA pseudouridine(13) synthase TruD [Myxococcales bacterium]